VLTELFLSAKHQQPQDIGATLGNTLIAAACEDRNVRKSANCVLSALLIAGVVGCSHHPVPPQPPVAKSRTAIALPQAPGAEITYSGGSDKLYIELSTGWLVVPLSAPTQAHEFPDHSTDTDTHHIVVNDKLKLGYALGTLGAVRVFNTDNDTVVTTTQPVCEANVLAVNERTDNVYGGGYSARGECLVQIDSSGHVVRDDVGGAAGDGHNIIQRITVDPTNGDVIYSDPAGITRADESLKEKWRTAVAQPFQPLDVGLESATNRIYVSLADNMSGTGPPVPPPASFPVYDGHTGKQVGTVPGQPWDFVADGSGHVFTVLSTAGSRDLSVLTAGGTTPSKFASLEDIPGLKPRDMIILGIDRSGHRIFVRAGRFKNIYVYAY
jgi:hypothetical protein